MKNNLGSSLLLIFALCALGLSIAGNPPAGVRWAIFASEPASLFQKLYFLVSAYVWPGLLSLCAISMIQLQMRLSQSGANKRTIFSICFLASGAMLLSLRAVAFSPTSGPGYVAGMALGYTVMSRLYAVRMRTLFNRVHVPWPIWRGNAQAMQEIDALARLRMSGSAGR